MTKRKPDAWDVPEGWPVRERAQYRPLSWFIPYDNNPRSHPPAQITLLGGLLKRHGPDQPIVVDEHRIILKGHGRRLAAIEGGLEQFTFVMRKGLSEVEKAAMRIADNQVALLAGWDHELVRVEMAMLKAAGYDMPLLGFGEQQLVEFTTTPGPPGAFPAVGSDLPTAHECPRCHYRWSGSSAPPEKEPEKKRAKKK